MRNRWLLLGGLLILTALILATPLMLRAIPPRYAARYLPEILQELAAPETGSPILPTVALPADARFLIAEETPTAVQQAGPPPTFTPIPVVGAETAVSPTETPPPPTPTSTPLPIPAAARLDGIYHQFQDWNNCGPATMAMTMSYFGMALTQSDTAAVLKPNPEDRNVSPWEMADYVNDHTPYAAIWRANGDMDTLKRFVANGIPVIVEIGIDPPGEFRWLGWYGHYLLVVAYDEARQQFWAYDSWFGTSDVPLENADRDGRDLSYDEVATYWPHFNRNYIAVYEPAQAQLVAQIVGAEMDDDVMWANNLTTARRDAAADPENAFFWFNLGTAYNALARYEEAATAFDQARAIGLPWRMLWYQFGPYEAYYEVGRYEDVILLADTTLQDRPYFEESFYYRGLAHQALGDAAAARENLQRAARFNPNFDLAVAALEQLDSGG